MLVLESGNSDDALPNMTTFNSESSSASSSSRKFDLDPTDISDILVYKVREGCHICSQKDLCAMLDLGMLTRRSSTASHVNQVPGSAEWRCARVPIPRGASRVHIQTRDLWTTEEKTRYAKLPNAELSVASVGLSRSVYWRRMIMGHFQSLYVVSPDHSPASSENPSPDNSQHSTPASTFNVGQGMS